MTYNIVKIPAKMLKPGDEFYPPTTQYAAVRKVLRMHYGQYGGLTIKAQTVWRDPGKRRSCKITVKPDQLVRVIRRS